MELVSYLGYALISGLVLAGVLYWAYRKGTTGKVIVWLYTKNKKLVRYATRPSSDGLINIRGGSYHYNDHAVIYATAFLLKETVPTLFFVEGKQNAVHPFNPTIATTELRENLAEKEFTQDKIEEIIEAIQASQTLTLTNNFSAQEASEVFNSDAIHKFVQAGKAPGMKEIMTYILMGALVLSVVIGGGFYYLYQAIGNST